MDKKNIRIFVSSTFNDFMGERNILTEKVFPYIQERCRKRGFVFQAVDLRWGITEKEVRQQNTIRICLDEIKKCQKISPKPNFFLLLGDRYGWEPLPPEIPQKTGDRIFKHLQSKLDDYRGYKAADLFSRYYRIDENRLDKDNIGQHFYILQPLTDKDDTELEADSAALLELLRSAATELHIHETDAVEFFYSATRYEIEKGIMEHTKHASKDRPFVCYFRTINDIIRHTDINSSTNKRFNSLKEKIKKLSGFFENTLASMPSEGNYLDRFEKVAKEELEVIVDARMDEFKTEHTSAEIMAAEKSVHNKFAEKRRECFVGRANELRKIEEYIKNPDKDSLIVHGKGGIGKSAFIAQAIKEYEGSTKKAESILVCRFVGASEQSSDAYSLIHSVCTELYADTAIQSAMKDKKVPTNYSALCEFFKLLLEQEIGTKQIVIFVDAIDQLVAANNENPLGWIPASTSKSFALILSVLDDDKPKFEKNFANHPHTSFLYEELHALSTESAMNAIEQLLRSNDCKLTGVQQYYVHDYLKGDQVNGLHLKMFFEEIKCLKSYDQMPQKLPNTLNNFIKHVFERLADNERHGELMVKKILGYMALTYQGIAEDEIIAILGEDDDISREIQLRFPHNVNNDDNDKMHAFPFILWARFYSDIEGYIKSVSVGENTHHQFYHRLLEEFVLQQFLPVKFQFELHNKLCTFFEEQPLWQNADETDNKKKVANVRKLKALPYHLRIIESIEAKDDATKKKIAKQFKINFNKLRDLICDEEYFKAKISAGLFYDYLHEAIWVYNNSNAVECEKSLVLKIFQIAAKYYVKNSSDEKFWDNLHSFIIYSRTKSFHKDFFDNADSVEKMLQVSGILDKNEAQAIYKACLPHRANYYRRIGEITIAVPIILEGIKYLLPDRETLDLHVDLIKPFSVLGIDYCDNNPQTVPDNIEKLQKKIKDIKNFSKALYEYGFLLYLQNKFDDAFETMMAGSYLSALSGEKFGKLLSRCVGYHFYAFATLFIPERDERNERLRKYKEILEDARPKFKNIATLDSPAERWFQANTVQHLGFAAAYMEDKKKLSECVDLYEKSPWVLRTDDKSNLMFMQARNIELKAKKSKEVSDYEQACIKMQDFIEYHKELFLGDENKIEHLSQFYLSLGNSYLGAKKLDKAHEAWQKAAALDDMPGNKIWKEEAKRQLEATKNKND